MSFNIEKDYKITNKLEILGRSIKLEDIHRVVRGKDFHDGTPYVVIQYLPTSTLPAHFVSDSDAQEFEQKLMTALRSIAKWNECAVASWEHIGHEKIMRGWDKEG